MEKKKRNPPSKLRYDRSHPIVSVRVTQDLYDKLNALRNKNGLSLREILAGAIEGWQPSERDVLQKESEGKTGSKKNTTRERRRSEIIRVAARLFAERGYSGVTLDELAEQMGITKPALYQYINSKEEILHEICKACMVTGYENWKRVNKSGLTPREKLKSFIKGVIKGAAEGRDMMTVLFGDSNALSPEVKAEFLAQRKAHDAELEALLYEGVTAGEFRIKDIKLAVFTILGACLWVYQWYRPNGRLSADKIAEGIIQLLEDGYLNKS